MRVLHLTDLHLTHEARGAFSERLAALRWAIEGIGIDFVVVSGDLTRKAGVDEYHRARSSLHELCALLTDRMTERLIIVPGDRDRVRKCSTGASPPRGGAAANERLEPFQRLVDDLYGNCLSPPCKAFELTQPNCALHWSCHLFHDEKIAFYGFSSLDQPGRGMGINRDAVRSAIDHKLSHFDDYFCVAIWHHGMTSEPGRSDRIAWKIVEDFEQCGFHLVLHGHTHKDEFNDLRGLGPHGRPRVSRLPIVATGSFAAQWNDRPEGIWNQASVIQISRVDFTWRLFEYSRHRWVERLPLLTYEWYPRSHGARPEETAHISEPRLARHSRHVFVDEDGIAHVDIEFRELTASRPFVLATLDADQILTATYADWRETKGELVARIPIEEATGPDGRRELKLLPRSDCTIPVLRWGYTTANALALTTTDCAMQTRRRALEQLASDEEATVHTSTLQTQSLDITLTLPFLPPSFRAVAQSRDSTGRWGDVDLDPRWLSASEEHGQRARFDGSHPQPYWRLSLVVTEPRKDHRYALIYTVMKSRHDPTPAVDLSGFIRDCDETITGGTNPARTVERVMDRVIRDHLQERHNDSSRWVAHLWHPAERLLKGCFGMCPPSNKSSIFAYGEGIAGHAFRRAKPAVYFRGNGAGASEDYGPGHKLYRSRRDPRSSNHAWLVSVPLMTLGETPQPVGVLSFVPGANNAWHKLSDLARDTGDKPWRDDLEALWGLSKAASAGFWDALDQLAGRRPTVGHAFISYYREDLAAAKALTQELRRRDIPVWLDEHDIAPGTRIGDEIQRAIEYESAAFIALISRRTFHVQDSYFRLEWAIARRAQGLQGHRDPFVFPVVVDELSTSEAVRGLRESQFGEFAAVNIARCPSGRVTDALVVALEQACARFESRMKAANRGRPDPSR